MPLLKPIRTIQINPSHPLTRGLTGCWLMNELTGEIVADFGSLHNNGIFHYNTIAPAWKAGKHGSAIEFGPERCIHCGTDKFGWDITNEISVVALVKQSASQTNTLFARSGFVRPCKLTAFNNGKFKWWVYTNGTNCIINSTSIHSIDGSEFVHVAGTWHAGDGRLYVNGIQEAGESSSSGSLSFYNDSQAAGIGGTYEAGNYYYCFSGMIEYVFVYNRILSTEEIRWLYRQPFDIFAVSTKPTFIAVTANTVSLAGSAYATSAGSTALTLVISLPKIELNWLKDALFNGMTANAFKLGTTLNLGWFWSRVAGCSALYRGQSIEQIDYNTVLTAVNTDACEISPPEYLPHECNSTYLYLVQRYNQCGYQEHTLAAIAKVSLDAEGQLNNPQPNQIYAAKAQQVGTDKVQLTWFYCPLEQGSQPVCFNIYYDNQTGQIDYHNPLAAISYKGKKFYSYENAPLETGKYLFAIRAKDSNNNQSNSLACLSIELDDKCPDAIDILKAEPL